jgi:ketosteroid isomerase-like protein
LQAPATILSFIFSNFHEPGNQFSLGQGDTQLLSLATKLGYSGADAQEAKVMTLQTTTTERAVAELIETYRQGFLQLDPKRLGSIWDREHDPLIYVAMERPEPIHGWAAIERYFEALPDHLEEMLAKKLDGIRIDPLGDAVIAFFQFHSTVKLKGGEGLYQPSGRVTMLFRRTQAGWRAIHYHESALAAQAADQINRMRTIGKKEDSQ